MLVVSQRQSSLQKLLLVIGLLLLAMAYPSIASGQEADDGVEDGDYVELNKDEKAPFDGYLFDHGGIAGLISKHEAEKDKLKLDSETELKKIKIILETELKKKETELDINKKLSEDLLKLNKEELQLAQNKLERVGWLSPTLFVGGIITGSLLTVTILKIAIQVSK